MSARILRVENLVAGYQKPVVGPVSFDLAEGEVLALSGPNGCGKSTLLAAILDPARRFAGRVGWPVDLVPAYQAQQTPLDQPLPLTAAEFLKLAGADTAGLPESLRSQLSQRVDRLSGGQRQLLRVWAALGQATRLVLLDEPTNNLDPENEALLISLLNHQPADRGVLLVCHEADFVRQVTSRVIEVA